MKPTEKADVNIPGNETGNEIELKELRMKVEELWPKFLDTEADHILDSLTEMEIRGVAKHAGLPVTEFEPKKVTTEFVQQIKEALQKSIAAKEDDLDEDEGGLESGMGLGLDEDDTITGEGATDKIITDEEATLEIFKENVINLYDLFPDMTNKDILESYPDMEIRGVAKMAGMDVSETEPKMESTFVTKIKEAIKHKAKLENITK